MTLPFWTVTTTTVVVVPRGTLGHGDRGNVNSLRQLYGPQVTETHAAKFMENLHRRRRHPDQADALHHALSLVRPRDIGTGMAAEFAYRS